MRILVAMPALNEEASIGNVLGRIPRDMPGVSDLSCLVVDDGSSDRTAEIAAGLGARVASHPKSRGVGAAFHTAVDHALKLGADLLVTIDADGQFDPGQIPELIAPIARGDADFVTGTRFSAGGRPENMPRTKYWGNRQLVRFLRLFTGQRLSDVSCGFRAYSREALFQLNLFGRFTYTQETILDLSSKGLRLTEVPIEVRYFSGRRSRVAGSLLRYGYNALNIIARTLRDMKPLRFFGALGAVMFILGVALEFWLLLFFLRSGAFSPYKFVGFTGLALNLAGVIVFAVALLADMIDRSRLIQERILRNQRRMLYSRPEKGGQSSERKRSDRPAEE